MSGGGPGGMSGTCGRKKADFFGGLTPCAGVEPALKPKTHKIPKDVKTPRVHELSSMSASALWTSTEPRWLDVRERSKASEGRQAASFLRGGANPHAAARNNVRSQ